jgi:PAS domain S-box-containing protein
MPDAWPPGDAVEAAAVAVPAEDEASRARARRRRRLRAVVTIVVGFTLLILTGALEGLIVWESNRKLTGLRDALLLHDAATEVLIDLLNAESGQRGYLIGGDPAYLESYTEAVQKLPAAMAHLKELAAPVIVGTADIERIGIATDANRREMEKSVALQRDGQHDQALATVRTGNGRANMDAIRAAIGDLEAVSNVNLYQSSAALDWLGNGLMVAVVGAVLAVIVLAAVMIRDTVSHLGLLERREASLRKLAASLERRVVWRTWSLTEMNRRFDAALSASGVTVFTQDNDLVYTWISKAAFGFTPEAIIGRGDDEVIGAKWKGLVGKLKRQVIATGETARTEVSIPEAEVERWYALTVEAQRDAEGAISGIIGGAVDITDRKEHEARIHLLMRELTHRSRNLLSVIQAIARQSAANSLSSGDFLERFGARLQSLADSQDLLVRDSWKGASMRELVRSQLGHYSDLVGSQIELDGGTVRVGPEAAQHIGMALHELATNAAKYGALSSSKGKVRIHWEVVSDGSGGQRCHLTWQETDGPAVEPPKRRGFGHVVIERTVAQALDGKVSLTFAPSGVCWSLEFPGDYLAGGRGAGAAGGQVLAA